MRTYKYLEKFLAEMDRQLQSKDEKKNRYYSKQVFYKYFYGLKREVEEILQMEDALKDLAVNHIEFVQNKSGFYFRIKGSKGKERSWTSTVDFWKNFFELKEELQ